MKFANIRHASLGLIFAAPLLLFPSPAANAQEFIQAALFAPDYQVVNEMQDITGVRFNIYGRNRNVSGLDLGFVHETTGDFCGAAFGFASLVDGNSRGVQLDFFLTRVRGSMHGWADGILTRVGSDSAGLQSGAVSLATEFTGLQAGGIWNSAKDHISGAQIGLVNCSDDVHGAQIGFVNFAHSMYGIQIGLWNQIDSKETWKVIPLFNWKF